jgi:hypothetical protein
MSGAIGYRNPRPLGTGVPQSTAIAVAICKKGRSLYLPAAPRALRKRAPRQPDGPATGHRSAHDVGQSDAAILTHAG